MNSVEIKRRFIDYFTTVLKERGFEHIEVHSSSLVPENHPTLLFTNSGMVQFTPYFLGEKDPVSDFGSKRLCSVQKSVRTVDLDIIGKSKYHAVFFEMLGSWSIGDYGYGFDTSKFTHCFTNEIHPYTYFTQNLQIQPKMGLDTTCDYARLDCKLNCSLPCPGE